MLEPKKGANFKLFKTVCLNSSTAEIMTSGWANVAEQISYIDTKTRETDSDNTWTNHKRMIQYLQKTIIWTVFSSVWVLLLQTGRIWNKSKNLTNDITFQTKIYHQVRHFITFHHDIIIIICFVSSVFSPFFLLGTDLSWWQLSREYREDSHHSPGKKDPSVR